VKFGFVMNDESRDYTVIQSCGVDFHNYLGPNPLIIVLATPRSPPSFLLA
jgi:hypothetical protein